jgi:transposase
MGDFATSGGHWYALDGTPRYTITGKNGKERGTTLRDAREHALVPSVTTIIRMAAAPALEKWKRNQVLLSALTLPRAASEAEMDWLARVEQDWQKQGRQAADKGTAIHGAIERHYRGEMPDADYWDWVKVTRNVIENTCGHDNVWSAERSFAHPLGYGGKTDLHSAQWVLDFKSKDGIEDAKVYDDHAMQLAAYRRGLNVPNARCGIVFIDRQQPSARLVEVSADDLSTGLAMFDALLAFWQAKTGYYPMRAAA